MSLAQIGDWVAIIANLGVVAGFVLLAFQMRQSAREMRLRRIMDQYRVNGMGAEIAFMADSAFAAWTRAVFTPATLTEPELNQVWSYLNVVLYGALSSWILYRSGEMSDEGWAAVRRDVRGTLDFEVGRIVWNHARGGFPKGFASAIDEELAQGERGQLEQRMHAMVKDIRALASASSSGGNA